MTLSLPLSLKSHIHTYILYAGIFSCEGTILGFFAVLEQATNSLWNSSKKTHLTIHTPKTLDVTVSPWQLLWLLLLMMMKKDLFLATSPWQGVALRLTFGASRLKFFGGWPFTPLRIVSPHPPWKKQIFWKDEGGAKRFKKKGAKWSNPNVGWSNGWTLENLPDLFLTGYSWYRDQTSQPSESAHCFCFNLGNCSRNLNQP